MLVRSLKSLNNREVVRRVSLRLISTKPSTLYSPATNSFNSASDGKLMISDLGFAKSFKTSLLPGFAPFDRPQILTSITSSQSRDVMQLWSLLEACVHSNYMPRAFSILESLYQVEPHRSYFIDDYNMYFAKYVETAESIQAVNGKLSSDLKNHFPEIDYNDKTLAIMVHNALKYGDKEASDAVKVYFKMSYSTTKNILSNVNVLTLEDYTRLFSELKLIKIQEIPSSVRSLVEQASCEGMLNNENSAKSNTASLNESLKTENFEESLANNESNKVSDSSLHDNESDALNVPKLSLDDAVKPLDKDAANLLAVDTIGMKVVRHTLLGLSLQKHQKERISKFSFNVNTNIVADPNENNHIDFFEIYNSLATENEQKLFDNAIDEFNHDRQRVLELRATNAAKERWKHDFEEAKARGDISIEKRLNVKLWDWYKEMLPLIEEEVKKCKAAMEQGKYFNMKQDYAPYMTLVDPGKMCVITILELLKLNSTGGIMEGMRTARAVLSVGKAIELEFRSDQLLKNESKAFKMVSKQSQQLKKFVRSAKTKFRSMNIEESKISWPQPARARIGSIMISNLIHVAKVDVGGIDPVTKQKVYGKIPAFSHGYQYHNGTKLGVLKIHKSLVHQLNGERLAASVQPQLLPMLVKPRPWHSWNSGGYYYSQSVIVRSKDSPEQVAYLKAVSEAGAISTIYEGLNVLGNTAWSVNRKVFDVVSEVWNSGKDFLDVPSIQSEVVLMPPPPRDADPAELREWKLKNKELANKFSTKRSVRCDLNYKLEIARAFLGEKIYFPHNLDFRGRAYPLSPHFNHLGNDMSRGLLLFWKGKKLGPNGLRWLKVHLSNLFGFDKAPLLERCAFAEKHIDDIIDSAKNPLNGRGWWKTAEKPWQALATCFELKEALAMSNPEEYVSHQPVHQDGTCNGLQHYAALGGDVEGATQVNLRPSERPMDVYSHVARIVIKRLEAAAEKGDEKAELLKDKITRKVVKQTVMTNVYGVTYVGATFQINKQLSDIFEDRIETLELSKYLTRHVFAAVRELFHGAHLIQDWLGDCASVISKSVRLDVSQGSFKNGNKPDYMSSVIWTTPLGLPIVQPYREGSKKQVKTNLQTVFITDPFSVTPVNARRQKAGFPPNFIHSLDASHMLLSARECGKLGLDFASVHDSYWTHATDVDVLNKCLREQFIRLHEVDLIERLRNEFVERYKDYVHIVCIDKTSDLAQTITALRADLSKKLKRTCTLVDEIAAERHRMLLLNSSIPEKVEEGKSLKTTISVMADRLDSSDIELKKTKSKGMAVLSPLMLPPIPPKGDFDVKELKDSLYFFS